MQQPGSGQTLFQATKAAWYLLQWLPLNAPLKQHTYMTQTHIYLLLTLALCLNWASHAQTEEALTTLSTAQGYQLQIFSRVTPLEINTMHSWELLLTDANGAVVKDATIEVSGGMPDHDHGTPTLPRVTQTLDNGRLLLQGVRFHMPGYWQFIFTIKTGTSDEIATFDFTL